MAAADQVFRCRVCGSPDLSPRFRVAFPLFGPKLSHAWPLDVEPPVTFWTIAGCGACGVHFANPLPSARDLYRYYADQEEPNEWEELVYVAETPRKAAHWERFAEKLTRLHGEPGRLLEIGPAAGHLLRAASDLGWSVTGIEASPKFAKIVAGKGFPVHQGVLETFQAEDQSFDLIVMLDVLEHLHDPISDLERCCRLLKPGGRIVVATCDIGSVAARYYRLKWRQLVISHTFYWTRASIQIALRRAGLEPVQLSSVRWWDPDPALERREHRKEFVKVIARKGIQLTWMPVSKHIRPVLDFQQTFKNGRLDAWLNDKIGDQAVMSEIVFAVAQRDAGVRSSQA